MSRQTRLFNRHSTYYFRAKVPIDLQRHWGKCEEKFSLKTKDRGEAKRLARQASADLRRAARPPGRGSLRMHPSDYSATRSLAAEAREAGVETFRYESVRDPEHGANLALLVPTVFNSPNPLTEQSCYLYLSPSEASCTRPDRSEAFTFPVLQ